MEFALASTVLMLLLLGLVDFGRVYYFHVALHGAAREGARHAAWFDPGGGASGDNPYLDDADILKAVNESLAGAAGIQASYPSGSSTCPTPTDGNTNENPPFDNSTFPSSLNAPYVYVCIKQAGSSAAWTSPGAQGLTGSPSTAGNTYLQGDVDVILEMSYGLVTGFMQQYIGNQVRLATNAHFDIQGSTP